MHIVIVTIFEVLWVFGCADHNLKDIFYQVTGSSVFPKTGNSVFPASLNSVYHFQVDKKRTHIVTNIMLGSDENYVVGVYNLMFGELKKGNHTIQLTVANDGKGNGDYSWDALSLFTE